MSKKRLELKVGLFVLMCLIAVAVLMLQFSKGTTFFLPTYNIRLKASNVGGLKTQASVLMSGVKIGTVSAAELSPEGTNVTITLKIYKIHVVREGARFTIETSGFLGDQYVAVYPGTNGGAILGTDGHMDATAEEPFNVAEAARSAVGFIQRLDRTASKVDAAVNDVRRLVLNEQTLSNLAFTVGSLRRFSEDAQATVDNINQLIASNRVTAVEALTNFLVFSQGLDTLDLSAQDILATNSPRISAALDNLQFSTVTLSNILSEAQAGHGLVGSLLNDQDGARNVSLLTSNLEVTSSNLNRFGLWRVLWGVKPAKQKETHTNAAASGCKPLD
jgi:phospholipid/cholesterol/gamma-HCH transport system substrate-binding protein